MKVWTGYRGCQRVSGGLSTSAQLARYLTAILRKEVPPPEISAPKTRFNRPVGPHRVFTAAEFSLERIRAIKDAAGVKVNDVALAITGGALRRYLTELDEAAETALVATIPLNMRTRRDSSEDNNQVGSVFASLHTDIADPAQRLQSIHRSAIEAQRSGEASPMVDVLKLAGVFAPALTRPVLGFWARNHLSSYMPVNVTTVVSNVAGPDFPLYCAGARLVDYYGLGVLTPGLGIFHMFFSYCGKVTISVLADREMLPQPERYKACLESALEELETAVLPRPDRRRRQKKPASRRV